MQEEETREEKRKPVKKALIALKDFTFKHDKTIYKIVKGEEVNVPKRFLDNLKTEKVIK